jgi:hypothetical protein
MSWNSDDELNKNTGPICLIPRIDCGSINRVNEYMLAAGVVLPTLESRKAVVNEVSKVNIFDSAIVAPHPGYSGDFYALPSGRVILRRATAIMVDGDAVDIVKPFTGFEVEQRRNQRRGTLKRYCKQLQPLLQGQDLLTFGICMSLAPLLQRWSDIDESFGFQLCGPAASGKSLVTLVAASAWGNPFDKSEIRDNRTLEYLGWDRKLDRCADQPLLLDGLDSWFALGSGRQKLEYIRKIDDAFHHCLPLLGGTAFRQARILLWSTSQRPVEILCGADDKAAARLQGRLLTIPVPDHRKGKVIVSDALPDNMTALSLGDQIKDVIRDNHGRSAVRMIRKLLEAGQDEDRLRRDIRELSREFIARCAVGDDDGIAFRAARRFALVAAAGQLGRQYGAIPKSLDTDAAVMACYQMFRNGPLAPSFEDRLRALMTGQGVVDLGSGLIGHSQKMTVAARAMAEKKTVGHRS